MKKLLFIHNKLVCGGAESALFSLLCMLDKSKYDITVFVLHDGGEWEQKFRDAGIRVIHSYSCLVPGHRIRNFILRKRIMRARRRYGKNLISLTAGQDFDMVICYHLAAAYKMAGMELCAPKIRYVHGDAQRDQLLRGVLLASVNCLRKCNRVICVSGQAKQSFIQVTGMKDQVCVCFNPICSSGIRIAAKALPSEKLPENYICAVGRLSEEKGFARLIHIHKKLRDTGIEHSLVIVGDGPQREELESLVRRLGVEGSVILTGYRENPYCYMAGSKFTVCSSFTEGLPVIAMESISLGVPIVSAYPSVGELFGDEFCGIITENDDDSLEAGIKMMLTDKVCYEKAVAGARIRSEAFSEKRMVAEVERIYDTLLKWES